MKPYEITLNPKLDLSFERVVDVPRELVWKAWTEPKHLMKWFCPKPWMTTACEIDLRPGGKFRSTMEGPNGEKHDNTGCYLEVYPYERLTWTAALETGFRPVVRKLNEKGDCTDIQFTAFVILEDAPGGGTKYKAIAMHPDEASKKVHEDMGFEHGWGAALQQLVDEIKSGSIQ